MGISKKEGKTYTYVPLISKNEYTKFATKNFLKKFFNGSISEFLLQLYDNPEFSNEIESAINKIKK